MTKNIGIYAFLISFFTHLTFLSVKLNFIDTKINVPVKKGNVTINLNKFAILKKQIVDTDYEDIKQYDVNTDQLGEYNQDIPVESKKNKKENSKTDNNENKESMIAYNNVNTQKDTLENDLEKNIDSGNKNLLKTKKFAYYNYYKTIKIKVDKEWDRNFIEKKFKDKELEVLVQIAVDQSGNIIDVVLDKKSTDSSYDKIALNVFRHMKKMEPPPKILMNNQKIVYLLWAFSIK